MLNYKLFAVLAIVLVSGIFYGEAFAINADSEYTPTQTNAYASYNNSTNQIQVSWNFNTMTAGDKCVIKADIEFQATATIDEVPPVRTAHYIPNYYSAISSSPTLLGSSPSYSEEVECELASFRIDLDTIMNSSLNPGNLSDLMIFLSFYATDDITNPSLGDAARIDEVFVVYSPEAALVNGGANDQIQWACDKQIGSVLYIDQSGSSNTIIAHGNNGDNCTDYVYIENNQYVDIGMADYPGLTLGQVSKGNHVEDAYSLLYQVVVDIIALVTSNGGDDDSQSKPTFGFDHNTFVKRVDNGLVINGTAYDVTDNYHTPFPMLHLKVGEIQNFTATVFSPNPLDTLEFAFGIEKVGKLTEAEASIEIKTNYDGEVLSSEVTKDTYPPVLNATSLESSVSKVKCVADDNTEPCYRVSIEFSFMEAPLGEVFGLQAIDDKRKFQMLYFNDGITLEGDSQNPPVTKEIISEIKYKGLQTVQRIDKENDIWMTLDKSEPVVTYQQNDHGSFFPLEYRVFEKIADDLRTNPDRLHSEFIKSIKFEQTRAIQYFDSALYLGQLPDSWSHDWTETDRMDEISDKVELEKIRALETYDKTYQDNEKSKSNH